MNQIEQTTPITDIPADVFETFSIMPERVRALGGGLVNCTYLVEGLDRKVIFQKLGDAIRPEMVAEMDIYSRHLDQAGWEAPLTLATSTGDNFHRDAVGGIWRGLQYIESDPNTPVEPSRKTLEGIGSLLGRWHGTMSWLDYEPRFGIPHFHDTNHHAKRLLEGMRKLPSAESAYLASDILKSHLKLPALAQSPAHLIHGDPKLNNILFRDGKPITFIDLDTIMRGPIWFDIGDMLRSILSKDISAGNQLDRRMIDSVAAGYFDATRPGIRLANFTENAVLATKQIALELAMRYLNDINDNYYFSWDAELYSSRHDNHLSKAGLQWQLFSELDN